jgi:DNA repair protein RecO (recombination protein O)
MMTAALDPAWILSQRPYGNSGRLVECFTLQQGRFGAVAKGVHRKTHGGAPAQLLQVFYPLLVACSGRSELKQLTRIEAAGMALRPMGNAVLCGLYVNELLLRLLPRFDPHPELFACYGDTLTRLAHASADDLEPPLRRFELALLSALGYTVAWDVDRDGSPITPEKHYRFDTESGFVPVPAETGGGRATGVELLEIAQWQQGHDGVLGCDARTCLKRVNRQALAVLLGDRPLQTRAMAAALQARVEQ